MESPIYEIDNESWRLRPEPGCKTCWQLGVFPEELHASYKSIKEEARTGCQSCRILKQAIEVTLSEGQKSEDVSLSWTAKKDKVLTIFINGGPKVLEIYRTNDDPSIMHPTFGSGLGEHMLPKFDRVSAVEQLRKRIRQCDSEHSACYYQQHCIPATLPRRVLDLAVTDAEENLRLIESNGIAAKYMTLSHCWGGYHPLTTTQDTIAERKTKITLEQLPRIFRQAVELCRGLGVRYLWIDSLCIIQGDAADWVAEAGKMSDVYANSFLNIAAAAGNDSRGKLFAEKREGVRNLKTTPLIGSVAERLGLHARIGAVDKNQRRAIPDGDIVSYYDVWNTKARMDAPLLTRAWVLQERLLASRNVYFHESEIVWDCRHFVRCECGHLNHKPALYEKGNYYFRPDLSNTPTIDILAQWKYVIEEYSFLDITKKSDRLPALSGIATLFAPHLGGEYLAGLWKQDIEKLLSWEYVQKLNKIFKRAKPYVAPTWSWASIDTFDCVELDSQGFPGKKLPGAGPVTFLDTGSDKMEADARFRIISAQCLVQPENPFGEVTYGYLVVQAAALTPRYFEVSWERIFSWTPTEEMAANKIVKKDRWASLAFLDPESTDRRCIPTDFKWFRLDVLPDEDEGKEAPAEIEADDVRCLILSRLSSKSKDEDVAHCVVLKKHATEIGAWERLGIGRFKDEYKRKRGEEMVRVEDSVFDTADVETFRVV